MKAEEEIFFLLTRLTKSEAIKFGKNYYQTIDIFGCRIFGFEHWQKIRRQNQLPYGNILLFLAIVWSEWTQTYTKIRHNNKRPSKYPKSVEYKKSKRKSEGNSSKIKLLFALFKEENRKYQKVGKVECAASGFIFRMRRKDCSFEQAIFFGRQNSSQ